MTPEEYKDKMDFPMELLAQELDGEEGLDDWEIVEQVRRKFAMLKRVVVAAGVSPEMLKAILRGE